MRTSIWTFFLSILLASCRPHAGGGGNADPRASASNDNAYCIGDTTVQRPDPGSLVREYLSRDGRGEFLAHSAFWLSATECAGEGTDYARVVSSYVLDSLGFHGDTARF